MGRPCQFRAITKPMLTTQFLLTLSILVVALIVIAWMIVIEKRPRADLNPPLIPTTPVLIVCGFIVLLAVVHLVNLAGLHTGRFR